MSSITSCAGHSTPQIQDSDNTANIDILKNLEHISGCAGITSRIFYHLYTLENRSLRQNPFQNLLANFEGLRKINYDSFLQDLDTIHNSAISYYRDAESLSGRTITSEEAFLECLKTKRLFNECLNNNKELINIHVRDISMTHSLIEELKKHAKSIQNIFFHNVDFSAETSSAFLEAVSTMSSLKQLELSKSPDFNATLEIGINTKLETVIIRDCPQFTQTPLISQGNILKRFVIKECTALINPPYLLHAKKLEYLSLEGCSQLQHSPIITHDNVLKILNLSWCTRLSTPPNLWYARELNELLLTGCTQLSTSPNLANCKKINSVQMILCPVHSLPQGLPADILVE